MAPGSTEGSVIPRGHARVSTGRVSSTVRSPSHQLKRVEEWPLFCRMLRCVCIRKDVAMKTELLWKHAGVQVASEHNQIKGLRTAG